MTTNNTETEPEDYLTCPNHGDERVRLVESTESDDTVECLRCDYTCQNFLKYPVAEVTNLRGERYLKDVLTGEIVEYLPSTTPWGTPERDNNQPMTIRGIVKAFSTGKGQGWIDLDTQRRKFGIQRLNAPPLDTGGKAHFSGLRVGDTVTAHLDGSMTLIAKPVSDGARQDLE